MSQTYGIESHHDPRHAAGVQPACEDSRTRFLVLIESASAGRRVARVLLASHEPVAEFDASAPEVQLMTRGLHPARGAERTEWDTALSGHSVAEREAAEVYRLDA